MPSLKDIRKRIAGVKSTQKITRAMKMVAGARLSKAQNRITELRPYALKTLEVLAGVTTGTTQQDEGSAEDLAHPLLAVRREKRVMLLVLTSDRGLCGAFNTNVNKRAEREWKTRVEEGQVVRLAVVGRKGRDFLQRRGAPVEYHAGVWDKLDYATAKRVGDKVLPAFLKGEVDAIYIVYNEFKTAMTQTVVCERLLPVPPSNVAQAATSEGAAAAFAFEPGKPILLDRLVPMYADISILRALYESTASELGARMTAMDSATKNAKEMIDRLTLQYNKARQAGITKELMEIVSGSEALKE